MFSLDIRRPVSSSYQCLMWRYLERIEHFDHQVLTFTRSRAAIRSVVLCYIYATSMKPPHPSSSSYEAPNDGWFPPLAVLGAPFIMCYFKLVDVRYYYPQSHFRNSTSCSLHLQLPIHSIHPPTHPSNTPHPRYQSSFHALLPNSKQLIIQNPHFSLSQKILITAQ